MTGKHLKVRKMGDAVMGVELKGDKKNPEPIHFRIILPFGHVDIARTTDDDYWIHIGTNKKNDGWSLDRTFGKFIDARIDIIGEHADKHRALELSNPDIYHLAVRLSEDMGE